MSIVFVVLCLYRTTAMLSAVLAGTCKMRGAGSVLRESVSVTRVSPKCGESRCGAEVGTSPFSHLSHPTKG